MYLMTLCNVETVAHCYKPTESYHQSLSWRILVPVNFFVLVWSTPALLFLSIIVMFIITVISVSLLFTTKELFKPWWMLVPQHQTDERHDKWFFKVMDLSLRKWSRPEQYLYVSEYWTQNKVAKLLSTVCKNRQGVNMLVLYCSFSLLSPCGQITTISNYHDPNEYFHFAENLVSHVRQPFRIRIMYAAGKWHALVVYVKTACRKWSHI